MRKFFLCFCLLLCASVLFAQQYDTVIEGGRVIDPESNLDAVRNVAIQDGRIVHVSVAPLQGRRVIHATGLLVAPGFIDLHQHGQDLPSQRVKAFDGVTTALEMEIGAPDVSEFLKSKEGHSLIHYGTTASHLAARRSGLWRSFARWNDSAQEWTRHRGTRKSRTDSKNPAAPKPATRRWSARNRHGD